MRFIRDYEKKKLAPEYLNSWRKEKLDIEKKLEDGFVIDYESILKRDVGQRIDISTLLTDPSIEDNLYVSPSGKHIEKYSTIIYRRNQKRKLEERMRLKEEQLRR